MYVLSGTSTGRLTLRELGKERGEKIFRLRGIGYEGGSTIPEALEDQFWSNHAAFDSNDLDG